MARFITQQQQTKEEMFDSLVLNAIDFINSSLDNLDKRPKNSIVDFYTAIELFLKARLMKEHWTLILSKLDNASINAFQVGDFHSIFLEDAIKRLKNILNEPFPDNMITTFKRLGEHRNQIVHFAHTGYTNIRATQAGIVAEQWASWHYLYQLLTIQWKDIFQNYLPHFEAIQRRMLQQMEYIHARYVELQGEIASRISAGDSIVQCAHCTMQSALIVKTHYWGQDYKCLVCGARGTLIKPTKATIPCINCGKEFEFFSADIDKCPHCGDSIDTDILISQCISKFSDGDNWCDEDEGPHVATCHVCNHLQPSVFYIDGLWSCVSCFDRGWQAIKCEYCDNFATGDTEEMKYIGCHKCRDENIKRTLQDLT